MEEATISELLYCHAAWKFHFWTQANCSSNRILHQRGHQATVVSTGVGAIKAWEAEPFDLILIDNQIPEMGGVEAAKRIRARELVLNRPRTAIIALTASAMAGDRERFLAAGMDG
jgi:CheY-like chemotaxis protein